MNTTVLTGLISAAASLIICLVNNHYQRIESEKKHEANLALISYRLEQLEHKVDLHNNLVERMYKTEENVSVLDEKVKTLERTAS